MHRGVFACSAVVSVLIGTSALAQDVRRVVTGLDANNHAVVLFDSRIA